MDINVNYIPNKKQDIFHSCDAEEVVYGGAKGGGKSCALVMECLAWGLENAGADMYLFRETFDDLEANLIKEWKEKVPKELYEYNEGKHIATLLNGTTVKFRYISSFKDAERYQGRSMDWIGVDELTKYEERSIQVLLSCLRSAKGFKPRFRATCNPGGIGHTWVKERYIIPTMYGKIEVIDKVTGGKIAFIPATVYDNTILVQNDPRYVKRLENLPETEKQAFLYGNWDIFEGQYFTEYDRAIHVVEPFRIPSHWKRYIAMDYGLDMVAVLWFARDTEGNAYVYKELHESDLIVSDAARRIKQINNGDNYEYIYAPRDLWNRRQETGKSVADIFYENGLMLTKASVDRVDGWLATKEWLKVTKTKDIETGKAIPKSKLKIFINCINLTKNLPQAQRDERNPSDVATEPHEITHILDALRYFCVNFTYSAEEEIEKQVMLPYALRTDEEDEEQGMIEW